MYRLRIHRLREIAAQHGDTKRPEIARRTGIALSSVYRYVDGSAQPDLNSALRIASAYGVPVESLMELVPEPAAESLSA